MRFTLIIMLLIFVAAGAGAWYFTSPLRLQRNLDEMCVIAQSIDARKKAGEFGAAELAAYIAMELDSPLRDRRLKQIREEIAQNFGRPGVELPQLLKIQSDIVAREGVPGWSCPVLFGL
ncbi:MAG: hypothetical protein V4760_11205 [Bdellovibrionota bacterium]